MGRKKTFQSKADDSKRMLKKASILSIDKIEYVDYKDVSLLNKFMSDSAKIRNSLATGNNSQQQREVARAIKNAREMGLLAYTSRVTKQSKGRRSSSDKQEKYDSKKESKQDKPNVMVKETVTVMKDPDTGDEIVETEIVEEAI